MTSNAVTSQIVIIAFAVELSGSKTDIHNPKRVLIIDTKTARIRTRAILRVFIAVDICALSRDTPASSGLSREIRLAVFSFSG